MKQSILKFENHKLTYFAEGIQEINADKQTQGGPKNEATDSSP